MDELKPLPCPFCGGGPGGMTRFETQDGEGYFAIECGQHAQSHAETGEECLAQWNTRSPAWRDIESAPRDGDDPECLAWVDGIVEKVYWDGHGFVLDNEAWREGPTQYVEPTHWTPLPLPPEEGRG